MVKKLINSIHTSHHRRELERYLEVLLPKLKGPILDIGSKNRRYDYLLSEKPTAIDIYENKANDVKYGDITNLNFDGESYNSIICLEVLEYVADLNKAVEETHRVLKKDGTLVLSIPFMYRIHNDKIRYTKAYLLEAFSTFSTVECYSIGNFYKIILDILKDKIKKIKFLPIKYLLAVLYIPLILFIPFSNLSKDNDYASGYILVAKK